MTTYNLDSMLPWDEYPEDSQRNRRILGGALILALLISAAIPFISVPKQDRRAAAVVPERIARVVERKVELPPPPPPKPKEEKKEEELPKLDKTEKPKEIESKVKPEAKPAEVQAARTKAAKIIEDSGVAEIRNAFADLEFSGPANLQMGPGAEAGTSRNMLTSKAGSGSGGLASAGYGGPVSSGFGGGKAGGKDFGLKGGKTAEVKSSIAKEGQSLAREKSADGKSKRTTEEIRRAFDNYQGRFNNAYQRALRDDPNLQGTVTFKLTIAPDGSVSSASIASSQLNNPEVEAKMLAIVRGMNFGADEVEVFNGNHSLNFFPN